MPTFIEGDVFKTIIPLTTQVSEHAGEHVGREEDSTKRILEFCKTPRSRGEIQDFVGIKIHINIFFHNRSTSERKIRLFREI